jgi:hypothetical protein
VTTRATLHELVDDLPPECIDAAADSLARLRDDPVLRAFLTAPLDDEPLDDDEAALVDRRIASYRAGNYWTQEQVDALFGGDG